MSKPQFIYTSLEAIWNNKKIWLYAFLVSILGGNVFNITYLTLADQELWTSFKTNYENIAQIIGASPMEGISIVLQLLVSGILLLVMWYFAAYFSISLVKQCENVNNPSFSIKKKPTWQVFWLLLLLMIAQTALFLLANSPVYIGQIQGDVTAFLSNLSIILYIAFIPMIIFLIFWYQHAVNGIVLEKLSFWKSISNGFQILIKNFVLMIRLLIGIIISVLIFVVLLYFTSFLLEQLLITLRDTAIIYQIGVLAQVIAVFSLLISLLIKVFTATILLSFFSYTWLLFYKFATKKSN